MQPIQLPSVPSGIKVVADFVLTYSVGATGSGLTMQSPDLGAPNYNTPSGNIALWGLAGTPMPGHFKIRTNTNQQIFLITYASGGTVDFVTFGYRDNRGK
jgi:hypothetical protein